MPGSSETTTILATPSAATWRAMAAGRERAVERLAAGHRDRVVVEDLVGDVDLGGDRGADREAAAVVVRAVAEVREDVLLVGERRLADPRHAFAAHVRERRRPAVHPDRHHVTADAGRGAAAFGDVGRRVVRAARAEVGNALERDLRLGERGLLGVDPVDARVELLHGARAEIEPPDPLRDHARDHRRRELRQRRQQPVAVRAHPFALLVELADHARAARRRASCRAAPSAGTRRPAAFPRRRGSPPALPRTAGRPRARAATASRSCRRAGRSPPHRPR